MARFFFRPAFAAKLVISLGCFLAFLGLQTPVATSQHTGHPGGGGRVNGGGRIATPHVAAPPVSHAPILRPPIPQPRVVLRPPIIDVGVPNFGFRRHPFPIRPPIFLPVPFFAFHTNLNSPWWLNCGPLCGWQSGCDGLFLYPYGFENSVTPPLRYENLVYVYRPYLGGDHELVELFLKDGTTIAVADYWFVNDEIHFTLPDEDSAKSEQVMALDELDLQKTINVNTRRGFRFVLRDEPMEQWLRDHPNAEPPLVQRPQKN